MAKKRKKTRKELLKEPDEFLTISTKLINLAIEYKTYLTYALGIILVLAVIISGIRFYSIRAENKASELLVASLTKYNSLKLEKQPAEVYDEVSADFQFILDKYNGKESAKLARLTYANICYNAGKYEQAIELYKTAQTEFAKHPMILNQVLSNLGYAYEQKGDYEIAVSYFEKISSAPEGIMRDEALYHLGRLYDELGLMEKSREAYDKILNEHQDFIYIDLVRERMSG
jgi:tetratricopeptide (TPR) repeat protein